MTPGWSYMSLLHTSHWLRLPLLLLWVLPLQAAPLQWPVGDEVLGQAAAQIRTLTGSAPAIRIDGVRLAMPAKVRSFYQERAFRPIWSDRQGILLEASELLQVVKRAETEGLPLQDYPLSTIESYLLGAIEEPAQIARLDLLLTDTFLHYSRNVRSGRIGPRRVGGDWLLDYTPFDGSALLTQALAECSLSSALASLPPTHAGYRRLREVLQRYRAVAAQGGWTLLPSGETLRSGSQGPRVAQLRERLSLSGDLLAPESEVPELFDEGLNEAVMRFQRRHGLLADGQVGKRTVAVLNTPVEARIRQIEANMERWRWLPRGLARRHIEVNVAGYELALIDAQQPLLQMRVIIGREYRQTPLFASEVTHLVLNPHWYVPRLIFREDILPTLRKDPRRFAQLKLHLLNGAQEVEASTVDWTQVDGFTFPYTLRQEPGPHNALGRIKFLISDSDGIYLHDTPDRHLFDRNSRALSSGCIRLEKPLELAVYLLANPEQWDYRKLEEVIGAGKPLGVSLPEPVPIYFTYWTVWVDQAGVVQFRDDIYDLDRRLLRLWGKIAT